MRALDYRDYRATQRFPALDGLRAVTVLSLIGMHYGFGQLQWLMGRGKITVFFVLSGFVITLLLLRDEEKYGRIRLRNFYIRRQFRLLPAYYAVLAITVVARYQVPDTTVGEGSWPELLAMLPYYLTFTHEWGPGTTDITTYVHSWTLAFEQKFYLVWPLVFAALTKWAPRWRLPAVAAIALSCLAVIPLWGDRWVQYFALILGCVLGLALHDERTYRMLRPLTHPATAFLVALAFLALHVYIGLNNDHAHDPIFAWYAVGVFFLLVSLLNTGVVQRILRWRFFQFVGERGYAMYLTHGIAGTLVIGLAPEWGDGSMRRALIVAGVTIICADAIYRFVELPSASLGRRFIAWLDSRKTPAAPTSPAPEPVEPAPRPVSTSG